MSHRAFELNEARWWSLWADVRWTGASSYVVTSKAFGEYFFNRGALVDCAGGRAEATAAEAALAAAGKDTYLTVPEACASVAAALERRGYVVFDRMTVMRSDRLAFRVADGLELVAGEMVEPVEWANAYSLSFYGDASAAGRVERIISLARGDPAVTLLVGVRGRASAGVLAAYRTPGLLGVYCVGTVQGFRGAGVAGALLTRAGAIASSEGRTLFLQTILSDGVNGFYARGGFRPSYTKLLMKGPPAAGSTGAGI